eukprot:PLAT13439.1.p1 GENE.PLAT13439.1~~PLAT13439.1.p1  ORF type:complete len:395 (+),score=80.41 PLAT13439.1:36-1187(+)
MQQRRSFAQPWRVLPAAMLGVVLLAAVAARAQQPAAAQAAPTCDARNFLASTLPNFVRECSMLPRVDNRWCPLGCVRAFRQMNHRRNQPCVHWLLNSRDQLVGKAGNVSLPTAAYFSRLFTEAFSRCLFRRVQGGAMSDDSGCPLHELMTFKDNLAPSFFHACASVATDDKCSLQCSKAKSRVSSHPCFERWLSDVKAFSDEHPDDHAGDARMKAVEAAGVKCEEVTLQDFRQLCSDEEYTTFHDIKLLAMQRSCAKLAGGVCSPGCAHAYRNVIGDRDCLARMGDVVSEEAGSSSASAVELLRLAVLECERALKDEHMGNSARHPNKHGKETIVERGRTKATASSPAVLAFWLSAFITTLVLVVFGLYRWSQQREASAASRL